MSAARGLQRLLFVLPFLLLAALPAARASVNCAAPPYGAPANVYRAYMEDFEPLLHSAAQVLPWICRARYGKASRAGFYAIGITDAQLDREDYGRLVRDVTVALHALALNAPAAAPPPPSVPGPWIPAQCWRSTGTCSAPTDYRFNSRTECLSYLFQIHQREDARMNFYWHCFHQYAEWQP